MKISEKRVAVLQEHIRAESAHDLDALLAGMTPDCFNDVVGVPKPFGSAGADRRALSQALGRISGFHGAGPPHLVR